MATYSPQPFPVNGLKKLSGKEIMQRAKSLNSTLGQLSKPSCTGKLHVGIFFDGTGNNLTNDYIRPKPSERKHSNVVKLFNTYLDEKERGYFKYYIPGVGTPFPAINDSGTSRLGGAFAWDGEKRVIWAFTRILNAVQQYVLKSLLLGDQLAALITDNMASSMNPSFMRRYVLRHWQETLASNLKGKKPQIELINLSVFGFSRGAAEARAFCNWLVEVCEEADGRWKFAGIPIRFSFLGIFDTVASVGIPDALNFGLMEGHQSWADNNLQIHPAIEQCVHFVAGHEVRASFPLDSVRVNGVYPGNAKEVMYPGAHSDVGGGYSANDLGISPNNAAEIARIPGAQMYKEARLAGVPLINWEKMMQPYRDDLSVDSKTAIDFNSYLDIAKLSSGPVESLHQQHMSLYLSYRYKYRNFIESLPFYRRASASHKRFIKITTDTFNDRMKHLTPYPISPSDEKFNFSDAAAQYRKIPEGARLKVINSKQMEHLLTMVDAINTKKLNPQIEEFFGSYVHDSMAGFIEMGGVWTNEYKLNGLGILKFRKIFKGND